MNWADAEDEREITAQVPAPAQPVLAATELPKVYYFYIILYIGREFADLERLYSIFSIVCDLRFTLLSRILFPNFAREYLTLKAASKTSICLSGSLAPSVAIST